jgi:hypothetical protein
LNAPAATAQLDERVAIEAALDALLTAAITADGQPRHRPDRGPVSAGVLAGEIVERVATWTQAQREANALLDRPVAEACRRSIRLLGKRLFEIGGLPLMQDVLYRVAEMDRRAEGRRIAIMDHRWDGIGRGDGHAGWSA